MSGGKNECLPLLYAGDLLIIMPNVVAVVVLGVCASISYTIYQRNALTECQVTFINNGTFLPMWRVNVNL